MRATRLRHAPNMSATAAPRAPRAPVTATTQAIIADKNRGGKRTHAVQPDGHTLQRRSARADSLVVDGAMGARACAARGRSQEMQTSQSDNN